MLDYLSVSNPFTKVRIMKRMFGLLMMVGLVVGVVGFGGCGGDVVGCGGDVVGCGGDVVGFGGDVVGFGGCGGDSDSPTGPKGLPIQESWANGQIR
jgi:hypothetical protein